MQGFSHASRSGFSCCSKLALLAEQESPVASRIKEAFMGDKGLAGTVRKLPLEDVYKLAQVKGVGELRLHFSILSI
jgi:hypothetical protein